MAVEVTVSLDRAQARALERDLGMMRSGVPRAVNRAVRRTVRAVRVVIVKAVREDLNVAASKLFQSGNSRRRPITERLFQEGSLVVGGRVSVAGGIDQGGVRQSAKQIVGRIPLGRFAARQHYRKGRSGGKKPSRVSYKIDRQGGRKSIRDAFVATFRSGYTGVFKRMSKGRGALIELFGPSVPHVALKRPKVRALIRKDAQRLFEKNMDSAVTFLLSRGSLRGRASA